MKQRIVVGLATPLLLLASACYHSGTRTPPPPVSVTRQTTPSLPRASPGRDEAAQAHWRSRFAEGRQLAVQFVEQYSTVPYAGDWLTIYDPERPPYFSTHEVLDPSLGQGTGPVDEQSPAYCMEMIAGCFSKEQKEVFSAEIDIRLINEWWRVVRVRVSKHVKSGHVEDHRPPPEWFPTIRSELSAAMNQFFEDRRPSR